MKKNFLLLSITAILVFACSDKNEYVIKGSVPSNYDGRWVYLLDMDTNEQRDSALVENNRFTFKGTADPTDMVVLNLAGKFRSFVILEGGSLQVDMEEGIVTKGPRINTQYKQFYKELKAFDEEMSEKWEELKTNESIDPNVAINEYIEETAPRIEILFQKYVKENSDNGLGKYLFLVLSQEMIGTDKFDELSDMLSEEIKQKAPIKIIIAENEQLKRSKEGKMFIDFTIENGKPNGSAVSFSDYIGKGKYVLVDFWASWCGPCIAEFPTLREVYQQYKGDKFELLGVAVWDKREDSIEAIKKHNMTWPVIIDAQEIPTDIYGIKGIPQIILFGPDGTIVARDLRGEAIKTKLAELF